MFAQGGGQTSSTVLQPGGQVDQLVSAVQAGDVTLALMSIGDNDWFPVASSIANGSLSGVPLQNFQNSVVNNITTAVNSVLAAGGSVVLGGFSNITDSPAAAAIYANPVARANLENALSSANNQLSAYAASVGIPYIDFFGLEKTVFDSGSFVVGGVNIALHTTGPDPHNFFQDSVNAGTVIRGEIANLWLQGMNEGYGTNIPLLSDQEILALAGIGNEFVAETFAPATNFSDYTEFVPEPSSVMLLAIGLVGLVWRRIACARPSLIRLGQEQRRMPLARNQRQHLGLVDLRVGECLAMRVDRLLRLPVLVQQKPGRVGRRVINLEALAAGLLPRVFRRLDQ